MVNNTNGLFGMEEKLWRKKNVRENDTRELYDKYNRFNGWFGIREKRNRKERSVYY